jgi:hypothetical protein
VSARTVVLAGLALGAAIAIATSFGRDDDEERGARRRSRASRRRRATARRRGRWRREMHDARGDVSLLARTLNESVSEVDAR